MTMFLDTTVYDLNDSIATEFHHIALEWYLDMAIFMAAWNVGSW
jgi:hypothetical protein